MACIYRMLTDAAEIKKRAAIEMPFNEVKDSQLEFMHAKLNSWGERISPAMAEDVVLSCMNVPEIICRSHTFRLACSQRVNEIVESRRCLNTLTNATRILWREFIAILEERDDFMPGPPPLIVCPH